MGNTAGHNRSTFEILDGDVRFWIEQGAIHMIAMDHPYHDPVELEEDTAREIAAALLEMADQLVD